MSMFVPAPALRPEHDSRHPLHPVLEQGDRDARGGDRARELGAEILGKYDKNLSNLRLRLFSYNKFKMTIAIKRRLDHVLFDRNNALIEDLHGLAQVECTKVAICGNGSNGVNHSQEGSLAARDAQATPMMHDAPHASRPNCFAAAYDGEHEDRAGGSGRGRDTHPPPPAKRYRLTDQMKTFIWQLAYLSNECCLIENENALEGSNRIVRDEGMLKNLHQKKSRWDADAKGNRPLFFKDFDPEMSHDYG